MICLAADRSVEKDGADANADIDTGASAPAPPPLEIDAWPPPQRLGTASLIACPSPRYVL